MNIKDLADSILRKQSELSVDRSFLVAVSGIDGSGKGYITEKLITTLNEQNINAISINFHFDALFQELILPLNNQRMIKLHQDYRLY